MPWTWPWFTATEQTAPDWGRLQVVVDGFDATYFRDVPTQVRSWSFTEPFDDSTAVLHFPQVGQHEMWGVGDLAWLVEEANVELNQIAPDDTFVRPVWEGFLEGFEDDDGGLTVHCVGALLQADLYVRMPQMLRWPFEVAWYFNMQFAHGTRKALRTQQPPENYPGLDRREWIRVEGSPWHHYTRQSGRGDPLLTSYMAEVLSGMQDTVPLVANMATNGSFESGLTGWTQGPEPIDSLTAEAHADAYDGSQVMVAHHLEPGTNAHVFQRLGAVEPLIPYRVEAYFRFMDPDNTFVGPAFGGQGLQLLVTEGAGGEELLSNWFYIDQFTFTKARGEAGLGEMWQKAETIVYVPPTATDPRLEVRIYGVAAKIAWDKVYVHRNAEADAQRSQWTLMKDPGRIPALRLKDVATVHWTVHFAAPGVDVRLQRDFTQPNVIYGEGTPVVGDTWRNAHLGDIVSYDPIGFDPAVHPWYTYPGHVHVDHNLGVDLNKLRRETFVNYGNGVALQQGMADAQQKVERAKDPGWVGTVTLQTDPAEGSRFDIEPNSNIVVQGYRGADVKLHVVQVEVDHDELTVTLTVDSKARDLLTVLELLKRQREVPDGLAQIVVDTRLVWDERAGSGYIPFYSIQQPNQPPSEAPAAYVYCPANKWTVDRFFAAEKATIKDTTLQAYNADGTTKAVAFVAAVVSQDPYDVDEFGAPIPADPPPGFPANGLTMPDTTVLPNEVVGWGHAGQHAGYSPDNVTKTGLLHDQGSWQFQNPPGQSALWIAIYPEADAYFQGRLRAGVQ